ncbi:MAG: DUF1874 domain-containing protein, partial [Candidatus Aminicenantes bacterium]|nr:DUF1874 domain-containing protein [Candidatus Aminicenantes bacterium]NIN18816.1 DUF1874 domain-containing protein [Candidatus Aminicenantes bacterium]NIN42738.1 DUF1874 domain-containing protein [Candidatus Aminicenantes bacterium]NIN85469.1 DUF1874 domain-containing protein [Candidatus Aminicenantes bacterium]NIO81709.1 DUF1874 domain-containing protein [Candidatus Aminicenantes bacterium]
MSTEIKIVNHAILFDNGIYRLSPITKREVEELIRGKKIISHITYQGTATFLSALLGINISVNQEPFRLEVEEKVIVFRQFSLDSYDWKVLERL